MPSGASYGSLPFGEQIAFFRRKVNLPTRHWTDIWESQHDHAFVVAGANNADLVADFREAVDKAISQGTTLAQFRKDFDRIVEKHGWQYNGGRNWRSRVIYETNLRTSYMAGRYAQLQAVKKTRPYWQYEHDDSVEHPRPLHESWDGLVLDADNPWWNTHFPPNGWGCKCSVRSLSVRDLKRLGKDKPDPTPTDGDELVMVGQRGPDPRVVETPVGIDPGFGYVPGQTVFEQLGQLALQKSARLPAEASAAIAQQVLAIKRVSDALRAEYATWQAGVVAANQPRNVSMTVGSLDAAVLKALKAAGVTPKTSPIIVRDAEVLRVIRDSKAALRTASGLPKALLPAELENMPQLLADPQAVLLDAKAGSLLFVFPAQRREAGKLVVFIDYVLKTTEGSDRVNSFRSASLIQLEDVRKDVRAGALVLLKGTL